VYSSCWGLALLIALGFEFVNGFHDMANAVATVIYTHSLPPQVAVPWSGMFNFLGVLASSGVVAWAVVSLLPVAADPAGGQQCPVRDDLRPADRRHRLEPRHLVARPAGNSSHTIIGSIIGVGLANQLMAEPGSGVSGVDCRRRPTGSAHCCSARWSASSVPRCCWR
jgi:PiT family inorganic phosphate transporter